MFNIFDATCKVPKPSDEQKDFVLQGLNAGKTLYVTIDATHAGIITRNHTFYLPDKMRNGAESFVSPYPKPVQLHHNDMTDPIGRVINSEYIDTSGMVIQKKEGKKADKYNTLINAVSDEALPVVDRVKFVGDLIDNITRDKQLSNSYSGLGHIRLTVAISDKDAAEKIMDGRHSTVSIGAVSDSAICSICKQDWVVDGPCDHYPGTIHDGQEMYLIVGSLMYDEVSFVNRPADVYARVSSILNSVQDNAGDSGVFQDKEKKDYSIVAKDYEVLDATMSFMVGGDGSLFDSSKPTINLADSAPVTDPPAPPCNCDTTPPATPPAATAENKPLDFDTIDISSEQLTEDEADFIYQLMFKEMEPEEQEYIKNEVAEAEGVKPEELDDAKLSAAQRKRLPNSAFCGPNRSFPVTSCSKVVAARRLIGRYKGPGSKEKILACVSRKAKGLGCDKSEKDFVKLEKELNEKHQTLITESVKNTKEPLEAKINEMTTQLEAFKLDMEVLSSDSESIRDNHVKLLKKYRALLSDYNALLEFLGTAEKLDAKPIEDLRADNIKLGVEALELSATKLIESVDISKITGKIRDGMSRVPTGAVPDPTIAIEATSRVVQYDEKVVENFVEKWHETLLNNGQIAADRLFKDAAARRLIPANADEFKKLVEEIQKKKN